ncbi:MAG: ribbon-helix-helix protein, CopG family [Opitutae bacterium]|jgi:hypothetical protein|nr:ribbon-helix-helix protein, CopG family [Opitutae bacterium]MBT5715338.1 ribbon-helix-helix protein, CopG family [Opitutae bacterium]
MPTNTKKRTQVSVSLDEQEKSVLTKQSFRQNRSVSQIMRFAIKKYLDGVENSYMKPIEEDSVEQIFLKLGSQLAKNADILFALKTILIEAKVQNDQLFPCYFSDNATAITGYDKYDLLDPTFFISRIHSDHKPEDIFRLKVQEDCWEHYFKFKKPHGEYFDTRISFQKSEGERFLATWQFLPS